MADKLRNIYCVLDRLHVANHTACLEPGNSRYLPEANNSHSELNDVNSYTNECSNAFLHEFVNIVWLIHAFAPNRHVTGT